MFGDSKEMEVKQFDFQNALANEKLDRPVYAELPKHLFSDAKRNTVVMMLQKSLYGLKDASKIWSECIKETFEAIGMKKCILHHVCFMEIAS